METQQDHNDNAKLKAKIRNLRCENSELSSALEEPFLGKLLMWKMCFKKISGRERRYIYFILWEETMYIFGLYLYMSGNSTYKPIFILVNKHHI